MSHNPSDNSSNAVPEWDRLWNVVRETPDDFNSWEQLVRIVEAPEGGLTANSPPENMARLESVYDNFLANFPLFFGYWKKYADWELAVHGPEAAEKVFERGVAGIRNSIDLWNQYIDFKMTQKASTHDIESLLERAANSVGYDFLAHPFWDKYIEFAETQLEDSNRVLRLLDRIVLIPMHQYARYYEKWRGMRANLSPSQALDSITLETFTNEIAQQKGQLSGSELEAALKEKMDAQTAAVYANTQEGTNKRWVYESEIKRPYFHVKPLDRPQLQNWSKYLDFEEAQNNVQRICALYERCLVPCAQYEEFWLRYGQWLTKNDLLEEAQNAYERASAIFLRRNNAKLEIQLALIQEEKGNINEARAAYTTLLEKEPSHLETILNYLHFERRQNESVFENLMSSYLNTDQLEASAKAFLTVHYAKFLKQKNQIDKARELYSISSSLYSDNKFFWVNYINFELSFYDEASDNRITKVFETARQSLPKELQAIINTQYREYVLERGSSVAKLNRIPLAISTEFNQESKQNTNLKRPLADDATNYGYAKQARVDTPTQQQSYNNYGQYGGDYYSQQQQQQQQTWQS